jgi:hypothetical protein
MLNTVLLGFTTGYMGYILTSEKFHSIDFFADISLFSSITDIYNVFFLRREMQLLITPKIIVRVKINPFML